MLIDEIKTRTLLGRIVGRLTDDPSLREDLLQEALVHLWLLEVKRPRQTHSWYLQNCKFHLQNYITAGKSVDSLKRSRSQVAFASDCEEIDEFVIAGGWDGPVLGQVSVRDIITQLSGRLSGFERAVLNHLAEGLHIREIALRLKVSHPTVIKQRRKIAALAITLGIPPLPKYPRAQQGNGRNGNGHNGNGRNGNGSNGRRKECAGRNSSLLASASAC